MKRWNAAVPWRRCVCPVGAVRCWNAWGIWRPTNSAGSVREEEAVLTALLAGVAALEEQCEHLVIVSNEVCLGGEEYAGDTDAYLRVLAAAHRALGKRAGRVCEVCAGRAVYYKGKGPEQ